MTSAFAAHGLRYGEAFGSSTIQRLGIICVVANVFWKDGIGSEESEAGLLLMRRSFGVGKTHIILRPDIWMVREPHLLHQMAKSAADQLLSGCASDHDIFAICDIILNSVDDLVSHPPESQATEYRRKLKEIENDGLLIRNGDQIILDARA